MRLIDLKRTPLFEQDLVYAEAQDEALALIEGADIVHLHNHIDVDTVFPLRLHDLKRKVCRVLRHFHRDPCMASKITGKPVHEILAAHIRTTVIARFQERYYPPARVVPNVLLTEHADYLPSDCKSRQTEDESKSGADGAR